MKCFLSNTVPAFKKKKKNQWTVVFYEIKLLTYNGSAHQHNPRSSYFVAFSLF